MRRCTNTQTNVLISGSEQINFYLMPHKQHKWEAIPFTHPSIHRFINISCIKLNKWNNISLIRIKDDVRCDIRNAPIEQYWNVLNIGIEKKTETSKSTRPPNDSAILDSIYREVFHHFNSNRDPFGLIDWMTLMSSRICRVVFSPVVACFDKSPFLQTRTISFKWCKPIILYEQTFSAEKLENHDNSVQDSFPFGTLCTVRITTVIQLNWHMIYNVELKRYNLSSVFHSHGRMA